MSKLAFEAVAFPFNKDNLKETWQQKFAAAIFSLAGCLVLSKVSGGRGQGAAQQQQWILLAATLIKEIA